MTPENGSPFTADQVAVQINPEKLSPGVYHATLSFSAWQGANAPSVAVTLKVVQ